MLSQGTYYLRVCSACPTGPSPAGIPTPAGSPSDVGQRAVADLGYEALHGVVGAVLGGRAVVALQVGTARDGNQKSDARDDLNRTDRQVQLGSGRHKDYEARVNHSGLNCIESESGMSRASGLITTLNYLKMKI